MFTIKKKLSKNTLVKAKVNPQISTG